MFTVSALEFDHISDSKYFALITNAQCTKTNAGLVTLHGPPFPTPSSFVEYKVVHFPNRTIATDQISKV